MSEVYKQNRALLFVAIPDGQPEAGKHLVIQDIGFKPVDKPLDGGFAGQVLYASFDPYLRFRMVGPDTVGDFPPFNLGDAIVNTVILKIFQVGIGSSFEVGDLAIGMGPIQEYISVTCKEATGFKKLSEDIFVDHKLFLGLLGMPGLTAYSFFYSSARPKVGETILISAAAGAVGQVVGQIAKREGLHVLGIVGSTEKKEILLTRFGFDGALCYRDGNIAEKLKRMAPGGIDIYFDNVGGEQLEIAIDALKFKGRIIQCGASSQYSLGRNEAYGIRNTPSLIAKCVTWQCCHVFEPEFGAKYETEHQEKMLQWIQDGSIVPVMDVTYGIENAARGLERLLKGENVGKALLEFEITSWQETYAK